LQLLHLAMTQKPQDTGFFEAFVQQAGHAFFASQPDQVILIKVCGHQFGQTRLLFLIRIDMAARQQYLIFNRSHKNDFF
jgi:hypothetical protein